MEQITAITEKGIELSQVIATTVEEATPVAEVIAPIVEEATPVTEAIAPIVEEVAPVTEAIASIVEEATHVTEAIAPIVEEAIHVTEVIIKTVEETNSLTATQKEALDIVFNDVKNIVEHIMIDADVSIQIKIMQLISPIIKTVQDVSTLKFALTGADKKAIVLECGRKCIRMMLKDHQDMLMLYNTIAEPALETMLDLSRKLKPVLKELEKQELSQTCCLELFSACMSLKNK